MHLAKETCWQLMNLDFSMNVEFFLLKRVWRSSKIHLLMIPTLLLIVISMKLLLFGRSPITQHAISYLSLTITPCRRYLLTLPPDKEIEAQRDKQHGEGHTAEKFWSQDSNLELVWILNRILKHYLLLYFYVLKGVFSFRPGAEVFIRFYRWSS